MHWHKMSQNGPNEVPVQAEAGEMSKKADGSNSPVVTSANSCDVELQAQEAPEKTYYSKISVWFMVLFSGLAIGSDG